MGSTWRLSGMEMVENQKPTCVSPPPTSQITSVRPLLLRLMTVTFGPNIPAAHGSHISTIQLLNRYFVRTIQKMQTQGIKTICVNEQASREYNQHIASLFSKLVFSDKCRSW